VKKALKNKEKEKRLKENALLSRLKLYKPHRTGRDKRIRTGPDHLKAGP